MRPKRRELFGRLSVLLALGCGLVALVWGLSRLQSIFVDERDDALRAVRERQRALSQYAEQELEQALAQQLDQSARTTREALADPLVPANHLLWIDAGEQRLPRQVRPGPGAAAPAKALYEQLVARHSSGPVDPEGAGAATDEQAAPRRQRLALFDRLVAALRADDQRGIEQSVRAMLGHRAQYLLPANVELPITLAMLSLLSSHARPAPTLMRGLLREGLAYGGGGAGRARGRLSGLQRRLLEQRHRLSTTDFAFLAQRITAISERHGVLWTDFAARVGEGPGPTIELPRELTGPTLLDEGRWYVAPRGAGRIAGLAVDVDGLLTEIASRMKERGLLEPSDRVEADIAAPQPLRELSLSVESPRWEAQRAKAASRHRLKTALGVATGLLSVGILVLGWMVYRRRHRFVELKSGFVSAVSHELRTPLASIRLMAETLERRTRDLPGARDYPSRIIRDVDGLSLLVENILSFDRLSHGRWTAKREPVALRDLVDRIEADLATTSRRPVRLETEGLDGIELCADGDLLHLLLANLVKNACHYNRRDPIRIRVRAHRPNDSRLILQVTDNGVGIPGDETEKVFEDFYRSTPRTEQAVRGSGLGLAICRKIMEAHQGFIRVAETGDQGTTFEMEFPGRQLRRDARAESAA